MNNDKINLTKKEKAQLKKVIAALRSGKYRQGKGRLYDPSEHSFCCLGVACLSIEGLKTKHLIGYGLPSGLFEDWLPRKLQRLWFSTGEKGSDLSLDKINDHGLMNFTEIADLLEIEFFYCRGKRP